MLLNISKIVRARNYLYTDNFLKGDLKVQFGGKGLNSDFESMYFAVILNVIIYV